MDPQEGNETPRATQETAPLPASSPRRGNAKKLALIIACIFLLLVIPGAIIATITTNKTARTAEEFVAAVTARDFDKAYTYFSPELKQTHPFEAFKQALLPAPFDESCKLQISSRESSTSTGSGATKKIGGDIKCGDALYPTELEFIDTKEGEKINSYSIKPAK